MSSLPHPALASIRRILDRPAHPHAPEARCQLCGAPLDERTHRHVVQLEPPDLCCACPPCHLLFTSPGAGGGRWRSVPDRWLALDLPDAVWDALDVPVGVAFFVVDSKRGTPMGRYPGPAGVTESALALERWSDIEAAVPDVAAMHPDVEALVVRARDGGTEAYVVPVDAAYELAGRMRGRWEGLGRGPQEDEVVDELLGAMRARARRGRR